MARTTNGTNQYLSRAAITSANGTIAGWFKFGSTASGKTVASQNASADSFVGLGWQFATSNKLQFIINPSYLTSVGAFSTGTQYHLASTWGSAGMTLYVNGTLDNSNAATTAPNVTGGYNFEFGEFSYSGGRLFYVALDIAEFGVWTAALTAAEVAELAAGYPANNVRPDVLVSQYKLLDNDGDVDWWGQDAMTATNSPTYSQHPPLIYPSGTKLILPSAAVSTAKPWHYYQQMMAG